MHKNVDLSLPSEPDVPALYVTAVQAPITNEPDSREGGVLYQTKGRMSSTAPMGSGEANEFYFINVMRMRRNRSEP